MILTCTSCGGLYGTENGDSWAGKSCMCGRTPGGTSGFRQLTEYDVRRIIREELVRARLIPGDGHGLSGSGGGAGGPAHFGDQNAISGANGTAGGGGHHDPMHS